MFCVPPWTEEKDERQRANNLSLDVCRIGLLSDYPAVPTRNVGSLPTAQVGGGMRLRRAVAAGRGPHIVCGAPASPSDPALDRSRITPGEVALI